VFAKMNEQERELLFESIQSKLDNRNGRIRWTLEPGKGQTYNHGEPTLYAHDTYPRRSVMSGRPRRSWVWEFDSVEQAMEVLEGHPIMRYLEVIGGTTHVDVDIATHGIEGEY
jgi:hypothetical protein